MRAAKRGGKVSKRRSFEQPRSPRRHSGCEIGLNGQDSPALGRERRRDLPSTKRPAASRREDRDERLLARLLCWRLILWSRSLRHRSVMDLLRSQAAAAAAFLLRCLPPGLRERIKAALGALGHEPGWAHRLRARNLAQTRKRLDVLVEAIVERLELAQFQSLAGAACLEFGSGHLLSEALIYHLAGAARTVAIDHCRILQEAEVPRRPRRHRRRRP